MTIIDAEREHWANSENEGSVVRGTVTAPAAGAAIATLAGLPAGLYSITVVTRYGGTADVIDNMRLQIGGATVVVLPVLPVANGNPVPVTIRKRVAAGQDVTVNAVTLGAAGSVFVAHLVATKLAD